MRAENLKALDRITLRKLEADLDRHTREMVRVDRWTAFSWSVSRHSLFQRCLRQYYLHYYGSRRVREAKNELVSAVWWLKQVSSLRQWIGSVIHDAAQMVVQAHQRGEKIVAGKMIAWALRHYREGVLASQRGARHSDRWVVLYEHVYPDEGFSIDRNMAELLVADLTQTLLESQTLALIRSLPPQAILEADNPFQSFDFDGIPVFAIPDVLLEHDGRITIMDWKTGDITDEMIRWQMGVYQLYAHLAYDHPEEAIEALVVELANEGAGAPPVGGLPTLAQTQALVRESIEAMTNLMENVDYHTVSIADFPMTDNLDLCHKCGFKRACWRHELGDA